VKRYPRPGLAEGAVLAGNWFGSSQSSRQLACGILLWAMPSAGQLAGARARSPEDVGGTAGYANFLEIITDPGHPEHRETLTWCGGRFDPEAFNLDRTNREVTAALRANRRIRRRQ
jgi:hypothetical protein